MPMYHHCKVASFFLLIFVVVFSSCRKDPTSWNSHWELIVIQDTLNLGQLVTDSLAEVDSEGSYRLVINRNVLDLGMEDVVSIPDTVIRQTVTIPVSVSVPPGIQFVDQIENNTFNFDGLQLKRVLLNGGKTKIKVSSPIGTMCIATLKLPGVKKNGVDFVVETEVPAGTVANLSIRELEVDLTGYEIDLTGLNGNAYNIIQSQFLVRTDPNGNSVDVNTSQQIKFDLEFLSMKPGYVRGYFGNQIFQEIEEINLDFMDRVVSGSIDVNNVNITMKLYNGIKAGARAKINLFEGENQSGVALSMLHAQFGSWIWINQALGTWDDLQASGHEINLTSLNSNIEQFIEHLPNIIRVNFEFELNPYGNTSGGWDEIFSTSFVRAVLTADMPLSLGMNNLTLRDTFDLKFGEPGTITAKSGSIVVQTKNSFSFEAELSMQILNENNELLFEKVALNKILGSNTTENFSPTDVIGSLVTFDFNEVEMAKLYSMDKIVIKAVFNSPNSGQVAMVHASQFLAFKLFSNLRLKGKF